jgi:hypothetical protein
MDFQRFYVFKIGLSVGLIFYYCHDKTEALSARE